MKCLQMHYPESVSKKEFQNGNVKVKEYIFDLNGDSVLTISKVSKEAENRLNFMQLR